jgi:hypothetical protein
MVIVRPSSLLMILSTLTSLVIHGTSIALISISSSGGGLSRDEPLQRESERGDEWPRGMHPNARRVGSKMPGWLLDDSQNHEMTRESPGGRSNLLQLATKGPPFGEDFRAADHEAKS